MIDSDSEGGLRAASLTSLTCEEDLDESYERLVDLYLKQLDYSLSISIARYLTRAAPLSTITR